MEKAYWIGRKRAAMAMARATDCAEARLAHYELAGRYSIKAAHCPPFLVVPKAPANDDSARPVLRLPGWADAPPAPIRSGPAAADEAGLAATLSGTRI